MIEIHKDNFSIVIRDSRSSTIFNGQHTHGYMGNFNPLILTWKYFKDINLLDYIVGTKHGIELEKERGSQVGFATTKICLEEENDD